jgi:Ser/Thr protein kinase RdoA (MazF antagonist)
VTRRYRVGERLGAGREAEVHAAGGDAVVKLYRPGFLGHRTEATVLRTLDGYAVAPKLLASTEVAGRTGLVLERVDGPDMLSLLQRRPWRLPALARTLAVVHLDVHRIPAPTDLPELRGVLALRIDDAVMPSRLRDHAMRTLDGLPDGDRLCHGDYHPGNVLLAADRVAVIDWPNATRGAPEADHARTTLLLRWGDPLPGTRRAVRALIAAARRAFANRYAHAYRAGSPRRVRRLDAWLTVHAAARLAEGIEVEQATLLGLLDRARHRTALP